MKTRGYTVYNHLFVFYRDLLDLGCKLYREKDGKIYWSKSPSGMPYPFETCIDNNMCDERISFLIRKYFID